MSNYSQSKQGAERSARFKELYGELKTYDGDDEEAAAEAEAVREAVAAVREGALGVRNFGELSAVDLIGHLGVLFSERSDLLEKAKRFAP